MNGTYTVQLRSGIVNYDLELKRKITVIRGASGTGKTSLMYVLKQALRYEHGISINSSARCRILIEDYWELTLEETSNAIFFLDEDFRFIATKAFARLLQRSDNYFVIITRHNIENNMDEVYSIRTSGRYSTLYPLCSDDTGESAPIRPVVGGVCGKVYEAL